MMKLWALLNPLHAAFRGRDCDQLAHSCAGELLQLILTNASWCRCPYGCCVHRHGARCCMRSQSACRPQWCPCVVRELTGGLHSTCMRVKEELRSICAAAHMCCQVKFALLTGCKLGCFGLHRRRTSSTASSAACPTRPRSRASPLRRTSRQAEGECFPDPLASGMGATQTPH